jgi:16S rRNA C967 or C1407 C5-methylase (RsmB/RsmF family)
MIPPLLLDVRPQQKVIDLCAAPGSKTTQILEMLNSNTYLDTSEQENGLVIANDADYKRCYMMIHQLNRSPSAQYMATQYDASQFPNLRLSTAAGEILKFDRVLADVPCSGDGTLRKNGMIWRSWTEKSALGLHPLQVRIAYRGLQMLVVGGRMVYSTCSLNPLENEAVVAELLRLGNGAVEVLDVSHELKELKRRPGLQSWKVFDANGEEISREDRTQTDNKRLSMFAPAPEETDIKNQLARCIRVYPHLQDTGGFFIALLRKTSHLGTKKVDLPAVLETSTPPYPLRLLP